MESIQTQAKSAMARISSLPSTVRQKSQIIDTLAHGFSTTDPKIAAASFVAAGLMLSNSAMAAEGDVDLGIDGAQLKSLILGLIATIALIGTAYLTVLVGISAFQMIRRVIKG